MGKKKLIKEFDNAIENEGQILLIFSMAQDLVQDLHDGKEQQALNIITGASFALLHAIRNYKEIKNGDIGYRS